MPYGHTSFAALKTQLATRLGDSGSVFWTDGELTVWLHEALRTFGLLTGFWRERGTFSSIVGTAFYDLPSNLDVLLSYSVTDRDIVKSLQYALLEPVSSQSSWSGTEQFTLAQLQAAIQRRRDQFLSDTGCVVSRSLVDVLSPPNGRQQLVDSIIDVRRTVWLGLAPFDYYTTLWREDERTLTAADTAWSVNGGQPEAYSVMAPPPLELQLAPPQITSGQLELLTVNSGAMLDTPSSATVLGVPDDLSPAIKWGALADLLGADGTASDPIRAQFAEQRYRQYVALARLLPVVVHAELNGLPLIPSTIFELDACEPNWQNNVDRPTDIALAASNLIALSPRPDAVYSLTFDVVRKTPLPASDSDAVQIGREQLDAVIDYAEHLALFKSFGAEWHATERQAQNFLVQSLTYNQRLSAAARAVFSASEQSQRQKQAVPRRSETSAIGVGAFKGDVNAQS